MSTNLSTIEDERQRSVDDRGVRRNAIYPSQVASRPVSIQMGDRQSAACTLKRY